MNKNKKIVITPYFNEAHLARYQIGNMCDYLEPDIYVISEGLFPLGPEGNNKNCDDIVKEYTLNGEGKRSFDFMELETIVAGYQAKYPRIEFHIIKMDYTGLNTPSCFKKAYNGFKQVVDPQPDDIIFPSEFDLFITKKQGQEILKLCNELKPNQGFNCTYMLFFESPRIHWLAAKTDSRRIAYKYGNGLKWGNYDGVPGTSKMFWDDPLYDLKLFHYKWIRPAEYWEFRKKQVHRFGAHHKRLEEAKKIIQTHRYNTTNIDKKLKQLFRERFFLSNLKKEDHPKHFHEHESFKYYYE